MLKNIIFYSTNFDKYFLARVEDDLEDPSFILVDDHLYLIDLLSFVEDVSFSEISSDRNLLVIWKGNPEFVPTIPLHFHDFQFSEFEQVFVFKLWNFWQFPSPSYRVNRVLSNHLFAEKDRVEHQILQISKL